MLPGYVRYFRAHKPNYFTENHILVIVPLSFGTTFLKSSTRKLLQKWKLPCSITYSLTRTTMSRRAHVDGRVTQHRHVTSRHSPAGTVLAYCCTYTVPAMYCSSTAYYLPCTDRDCIVNVFLRNLLLTWDMSKQYIKSYDRTCNMIPYSYTSTVRIRTWFHHMYYF